MNSQVGTSSGGEVGSAAIGGRGGPVPVALALLDRNWPAGPPLADPAGASTTGSGMVSALEADPRYLIGRFQQALTALLAADLPPMDALTSLLSAALADAIAWRQHDGRPCRRCGQSLCERCNADWDQADRYHALARALGAVGDPPSRHPLAGQFEGGAALMRTSDSGATILRTCRVAVMRDCPQPRAPGEVVSYLALATLPSAPFWARRQTRTVLRSWRIWAETIETAELLVSELITNAAKFAGVTAANSGQAWPRDVRCISLTLRYLTGQLTIEVSDPDPRPPVSADADSDAEGGRGLMLVQALSKEWGYYLPPSGGKVVYCVLASMADP